MTRLLARTMRETPSDAELASHQLLVRGGFIRRVSPGVYNFLPLGLRVVQKVAQIVREEMDAAGAQEILMPVLCPAELWQESGRWDAYGKEMFRLKNRHERDELLGPTHEEVVTAIARDEIRSYKQLPATLYQIQSKFRDEIRPRFGLLRGREFLMKDAYSFHADAESLEATYGVMCRTYTRVFARCGLETRAVESDVGAIGGSAAHEFMVVVETAGGECGILYCDACAYAANVERAESRLTAAGTEADPTQGPRVGQPFVPAIRRMVPTPAIRTVAEQAQLLGIPTTRIVKTLVVMGREPVVALMRGDSQVNLIKLANHLGHPDLRAATDEEVVAATGVRPGFVGPFGLPSGLRVVADQSVRDLTAFSTGANEVDMHWVDANWGDDGFTPAEWADFRQAAAGEGCPRCTSGHLRETQGIEVGNTFKLGTQYSQAMNATFADANGAEHPFVMGCYGIGVTRTAQAAAEAFHDEHGLKWPMAIAPYQVVVIPVDPRDEALSAAATELYDGLWALGVETVLDDREERAGVKFKDADLIGFPLRITVGKGLKDGRVECKERQSGELREIALSEVVKHCKWLVSGAAAHEAVLRC
jgi:prolyl-tRNA synthetase